MIDKYEVFLEVLNTQNLTKAAENIHSTPPAISYAIDKLEEALGVSLLTAAKGRMLPTQEALELTPLIRDVIEAQRRVEERSRELNACESGVIRFGGLRAACIRWLPGLMKKLLEEAPEISLQPIMNNFNQVNDDLLARRLDVAIGEDHRIKALEYKKITDDPYMVFVASDHPLAQLKEITLKDLVGERLIGPPWSMKKAGSPQIYLEIEKMSYCRVMDTGTILSMVENHYAVAILTQIFAPLHPSGVRAIPFNGLMPKALGLLYASSSYQTKTMRRFLDISERYFKDICAMPGK